MNVVTPTRDEYSAAAAEQRLRITEIFLSIQGEANAVGWPTVFVRLTGCPLRCRYCDTAYAFQGGRWWNLTQVLESVAAFSVRRVCVTGGEPLAQKACLTLLEALCDAGCDVSLETSGVFDVSQVDARVARVIDVKTPGSGESERNRPQALAQLRDRDQLKFVICDRADYEWSRELVVRESLTQRTTVLFSPSHGVMEPAQLAEWLLADRLEVRLQLQVHKYIWGDAPGR